MKSISILIFMLLCNYSYAQETVSTANNTPASDTGSTQDILSFLNHDIMHGNLIKINRSIYWKYPEVKNIINFPLLSIDKINLAGKSKRQKTDTVVYLTNGDYIPGRIISLNNKTLIFDTICGGNLTIPRVMLREISHSVKGSEIYRGPKDEDEWGNRNRDNGGKKVVIKDGIMTLPGRYWAICNVNLPEKARIDFEFISPQAQSHIQFFFYTIKGNYGYYISQNGSYFDIERMTEDSGSDNLDTFELPSILNRTILNISIFIDKSKKRIVLMLNGKLIKDISDDFGKFAGKGKAIAFYNMSRKPVKIKNINISNWDGATPSRKSGFGKSDTADFVCFINRDQSSGTLQSIKGNIINFKTEFGVFKVPFSRIKKLLTALKSRQLAKRNKNDIQAFISGGGRITFNLASLGNGTLTGTSENFTKASFKINSFNKLRFNIYKERVKPIPPVIEKNKGEETDDEVENILEIE